MFNWILNTSLKPVDNFFVSRHFTMLYKCSEGLLVLSELCGSRLKVEIEIQNIVFYLICFVFCFYAIQVFIHGDWEIKEKQQDGDGHHYSSLVLKIGDEHSEIYLQL